ncbi:MAG: sensor histidine kinase [Cyanophyceae cyanobacterium]
MAWSSVLIGFAVGGAIAYAIGLRQGRGPKVRTATVKYPPIPSSYSPAPSPDPPSSSSESPPINPIDQTISDGIRDSFPGKNTQLGNQSSTNKMPSENSAKKNLKDPQDVDAGLDAKPDNSKGFEGGAVNSNELEAWRLAYYRSVQTEQFKSGFLARTAHELRSPLSTAVGLHQLVLSDLCEDREEEREFIQQANDAILKWVALLDHLIDVSKVTYSDVAVNLQTISTDKIFAEVARLIELQAVNRNLQLSIISPEEACLGIGDPKRLSQALVDLIEALITLLTEQGQGGALRLSARQSKSQLMIYLDSSCSFECWQEPVALLDGPDPLAAVTVPNPSREALLSAIAPPPFTSPTFALRLAQLLAHSMGGTLTVQDLSGTGSGAGHPLLSRFEIALPTNLP